MTKRKTNSKTNNRTSTRKRSSTRKRILNKKKETSEIGQKMLAIIIMAILLTSIGKLYRPFVLKSVYNYQCVSPQSGDYGTRLIFDAINLNHQIRENKSQKGKLLNMMNEKVIWFRKGKIRRKTDLKLYSEYDEFCFLSTPTYDDKDDIDRNYQIRFIGCHKYREFGEEMVKIENYFAKISGGRIDEIYPIPISELDKESHNLTNIVFKYYYEITFIFWLILFGIVTYITNLPEYAFNFVMEVLRKTGNVFR